MTNTFNDNDKSLKVVKIKDTGIAASLVGAIIAFFVDFIPDSLIVKKLVLMSVPALSLYIGHVIISLRVSNYNTATTREIDLAIANGEKRYNAIKDDPSYPEEHKKEMRDHLRKLHSFDNSTRERLIEGRRIYTKEDDVLIKSVENNNEDD